MDLTTPTLSQTTATPLVDRGALRRRHHEEIVEQYAGLVRTIARRIFRRLPPNVRGFEEDDLVSVGIIGLLDAWDRYEERDGSTFDAFAEYRIKGAILDEVRRNDFFPRRLRAKANRLRRAQVSLENELGRAPTNEELADALGMEPVELLRLQGAVAPYHFVADDDECVTLRSSIPDPARVVLEKELRELLVEVLQTLPEREQILLDLYFNKELKLREIADILEVTEGRVSQIKSDAIGRLRKRLVAAGLRTN